MWSLQLVYYQLAKLFETKFGRDVAKLIFSFNIVGDALYCPDCKRTIEIDHLKYLPQPRCHFAILEQGKWKAFPIYGFYPQCKKVQYIWNMPETRIYISETGRKEIERKLPLLSSNAFEEDPEPPWSK